MRQEDGMVIDLWSFVSLRMSSEPEEIFGEDACEAWMKANPPEMVRFSYYRKYKFVFVAIRKRDFSTWYLECCEDTSDLYDIEVHWEPHDSFDWIRTPYHIYLGYRRSTADVWPSEPGGY